MAPWSARVGAADAQRQPWTRQPLRPRLVLPSLDETPWDLAAQRGTPVLLNFWASWCAPCRSEMPSLEALAQRHGPALRVMAVNYREPAATARRFVNSTGLGLPVLRDADGLAAKSLGVHIFPTTVAIDAQGRARFVVVGECDWSGAQAARWVAELMAP